ncbi:unnamed protein product [Ectocarpus sp. 4 AP-2014]
MDAADKGGSTPLHIAARFPRADMVQLLVAKGANVDKTNGRGWTPLQLAVVAGNTGATQSLLTAGADITCQGEGLVSRRSAWLPVVLATNQMS